MVFLGRRQTTVAWCVLTGIIGNIFSAVSSSVFYNVTCASDTMTVMLNLSDTQPRPLVYLQNLKGYPRCDPQVRQSFLLFRLDLNDTVNCGVTKVLNKHTGHSIFYHRIVIEVPKKDKELLLVQCVIPGDFNMDFVRMNWQKESLPVQNYSSSNEQSSWNAWNASQSLALPYLQMLIRDKGTRLDVNSIVHPGSLLDLLIFTEKEAADHYGLSLRYLTLTDEARNQEEVIVMNGCSVDPFVIQIYREENGVLRSQFRAFKLQNSDFVIFIATVNVCLHKCVEIECYGQADNSGRRKREIPKYLPHYKNEVFDVELSAFLRLKSDVQGDIIREESTNETLDSFYDGGDDYTYMETGSSSSPEVGALLLSLCVLLQTAAFGHKLQS